MNQPSRFLGFTHDPKFTNHDPKLGSADEEQLCVKKLNLEATGECYEDSHARLKAVYLWKDDIYCIFDACIIRFVKQGYSATVSMSLVLSYPSEQAEKIILTKLKSANGQV